MGNPWENGDLYGKSPYFSWENLTISMAMASIDFSMENHGSSTVEISTTVVDFPWRLQGSPVDGMIVLHYVCVYIYT